MNETAVIALLKQNDALAMRALFDAYHAPLCRLVNRMIRDSDQSKDIVQDVFVSVWKNRYQLDIKTSLEGYLKKSAVNTTLNYIRRSANQRHLSLEKTDLTSHQTPAADHSLSFAELQEKADLAIQTLPERTRAVFTLIRSEEMSYAEVADALDISVKAVEKEMMKALRLLRDALKSYLGHISIIALALNVIT